MPQYEKTLTVVTEDLDELAHVNNVRYLDWIQDISKEHWNALVSNDILNTMVWVVMRHDIRYKNAAVLNDKLRLTTFIEKSRGAISNRVVEIYKKETNQLVVRAVTEWCLLNKKSFKPMRIPENVLAIFSDEH